MLSKSYVASNSSFTTKRATVLEGLHLRARLLRRLKYRVWKSGFIRKAKHLIRNVVCESQDSLSSVAPCIVLSSFNSVSDFLILAYLFRHKQLTFLAPRNLPSEETIEQLLAVNHVLYFDEQRIGYSFFRRLMTILRDFNRSVVISPEAARVYGGQVRVNPAVLVKIAIKTNVPILPVGVHWYVDSDVVKGNKRKCDVLIGKKMFISPRGSEFRDIFFKNRGLRQFKKLSHEGLNEIGNRVFLKLKALSQSNGADLSNEMVSRGN